MKPKLQSGPPLRLRGGGVSKADGGGATRTYLASGAASTA